MKKPWKKNFYKIPESIVDRINQLKSDSIVVGLVKKIPKSDITSDVYKHIGIIHAAETITYPEIVQPDSRVGRYSNYNINGRTITRRDLPKVNKTYSADVPNFGDWTKGSHEMSWDRLVFQKEHWLPRNINIIIEKIEEDEKNVVFKFVLDTYITINHPSYEDQLLFHCNLLQENCGDCFVFDANASDSDYIKTLQLDWELLPPGEKNTENNINYVLGRIKSPSPQLEVRVRERIEFFESLNPKNYITGTNRFSQYFGALFESNLVLLENVRYGNAIYIFFEDWKELSKLSRTELLSGKNFNFVRVIHSGNWERRVLNNLK